jgi:FkbM family methyltransferase
MPQSPLVQTLKSVRYARQIANWPAVGAAAWRAQEVTHLELRNGLRIDAAPSSHLMGLYKEIWYRDGYRLRAAPLRPSATVIDIGANIGMFALYVATEGQAARVCCYEPFPESFALLRRNGEQNHLDAIQPFQFAVAGARGQRRMQVGACYGWNTLFGSSGDGSIAVECVTLADVFERQQIERCHFLKLDCEGSEYEILLQAPAAVLARVERVALEYHDHVTPHRHGELVQCLRDAGFQVQVVTHKRSPTGYLFATRPPT